MDQQDGQRKIEDRTRIVLRPLASPLPLGFFAFGVGSLLLSADQLGLIPLGESQILAFIIGLFVFPLQVLAAILAFLGREPVGATVLGVISCFWLASSAIIYTSPPGATTISFGLFQMMIAVILLLLGIVGLQGKPLVSAIIFFTTARFGLSGLYEITEFSWSQYVSGATGCVIFLLALYIGLALSLEDARHQTVLPLGRRGEARNAVEGNLEDQAGPVDKEAGVRKQL